MPRARSGTPPPQTTRSWVHVFVALLLGGTAALVVRDALPSIVAVTSGIRMGGGGSGGDIVPLLEALDMREYVGTPAARTLSFGKCSALPPNAAPPFGFKPFHWKRLLAECRRQARESAEGGEEEEEGGDAGRRKRPPAAAPRRRRVKQKVEEGGEGEDGDSAAPPPRRKKEQPAAEEEGDPEPGASATKRRKKETIVADGADEGERKKKGPKKETVVEEGDEEVEPKQKKKETVVSEEDGPAKTQTPPPAPPRRRIRATPRPTRKLAPTPVPETPVPKPPFPMVCRSWHNTALLRYMWQRWKSAAAPGSPVGTEPPKACESESVPPRETPVAERHLSAAHPAAAVAAEHKWLRLGLSMTHVQQLRQRGVIDQLYVDTKLRILYCAVPKAGCTGIKGWMLKGAGLYTGGSAHNKSLFKGPRLRAATFMTDDEILEALNSGDYFKFTIVRNPYTRVLATYLERFHRCYRQKRRTAQECDMWKKALVGRLSGRGEEHRLPSDMTFMNYLESLREFRHRQKPINFLNAHWLSSSDVCSVDEVQYDYIGHLEEPSDLQVIYDLAGMRSTFTKAQKLRLQHSEGTDKKLKAHYTEPAHDIITKMYEVSDLRQLGYTSAGVVPGHDAPAPSAASMAA